VSPLVIVFALLPVLSTFLGGYAVFRLRHRLHPVMAFSAGILVATTAVVPPQGKRQRRPLAPAGGTLSHAGTSRRASLLVSTKSAGKNCAANDRP